MPIVVGDLTYSIREIWAGGVFKRFGCGLNLSMHLLSMARETGGRGMKDAS